MGNLGPHKRALQHHIRAIEIILGKPIVCFVVGNSGEIPEFVLPKCANDHEETDVLSVVAMGAAAAALSREVVDST